MKDLGKKTLKFIAQVLLSTLIVMALTVCINGMYLLGVPEPEKVEKVTVLRTGTAEAPKVYTDAEHIDLAVHLTGFLKYSLFRKPTVTETPAIEIVYELKDGRTLSVVADEKTVWWRDKVHALKQEAAYTKLAKGIFFTDTAEIG